MSQDILSISPEVLEALRLKRPIVALESSVISQGLPRPLNLDAAIDCEQVARDADVVPATIAVIDGVIRVGLSAAEIELMATTDGIEKAGVRDLPFAVIRGATMATTVGATITIGHLAGISVMATGGIGGVHRGFEHNMDISHDLVALQHTPMLVVSAGFKSILDLPRTLEYLETLGVAVVGYRTEELPDFYSRTSGYSVPSLEAAEAAQMMHASQSLGLNTGIVVANPPPAELAFSPDGIGRFIGDAVRVAQDRGISGKALTPFLLGDVAHRTAGRSVELNIALLRSNVQVAAEIAKELAVLGQA